MPEGRLSFASILSRRWRLFLAAGALFVLGDALVVALLPPLFRSASIIEVAPASDAPIGLSAAERKARLLPAEARRIAREAGLRPAETVLDAVEGMWRESPEALERALRVEVVGEEQRHLAVEVSGIARDGEAAREVAASLTARLVEMGLLEKIATAQAALAALAPAGELAAALAAAAEELEALEASWFLYASPDELATEVSSLAGKLADLERQGAEAEARLRVLDGRLGALAGQQVAAEREIAAIDSTLALLPEASPATPPPLVSPREQRLREDLTRLEDELAALAVTRTERHPDVRRARAQVEALRTRLAAFGPVSGPAPLPAAGPASAETERLEARRTFLQQRSADLLRETDTATAERHEGEGRCTAIAASSEVLTQQRARREALLAGLPAQRARLEACRARHAHLSSETQRREDLGAHLARLSTQLAEMEDPEARIVRAPEAPAAPFAPNRLACFLAGLLGLLPLAFLLGVVARRDRTFYRVEELHELADGIAILGEIPRLHR